ncbi:MAG: glycosyltransferase family 9 protein [Thermodesulfobacteriota bacterium]
MEKKILVLRLSAIGDVIRTLPAVMALKQNLSSYITWIVEEPSKSFLESQPEIDEVILFPRERWAEGLKSIKTIKKTIVEMVKFISSLRRKKFDIVLDFHGILKSGLLSFLSGSPRRVGFGRKWSKEGNFIFSNIKVSLLEEKISRYQRNFLLLRGIGLEIKNPSFEIHIPVEDKAYIDSFFNSLPNSIRKPFIAIHPGSSPKTPYKRWGPDRFAELADRLVKELDATVLFTWGPEELQGVKSIQSRMKGFSLLGPRTYSLTQLGELYRRCTLYIGGDTGPTHIASLVKTPGVVIFGPTDPIVNEPFGVHIKVRKEVGCNPCRNRSCEKLTCLRAIEVEDVFKAVKAILPITN